VTTGKKDRWPEIRGTKVRQSKMSFHHDADIFRPNGVSRRTPNRMKALDPSSFGVQGVIGEIVEAEKPIRVSAKRATGGQARRSVAFHVGDILPILLRHFETTWKAPAPL
jgi:hypothetical protein